MPNFLSTRTFLLSSACIVACVIACSSTTENTDGGDGGTTTKPPPSGCTPAIASIQEKLFAVKCASSSCHSAEKAASGLDLASPNVEARLVGIPSACPSKMLVDPGKPEASFLIDKLKSDAPVCSGDVMPPTGTLLDPADVACITGWIASLPPGSGGGDAGTTINCASGETACGVQCKSTKSDPQNCGTCGNVCGGAAKFCVDGACSATCPLTDCSAVCVDTKTDANNCGACGNKCTAGKLCVNGACSCGATVVTLASIQSATFTPSCTGGGCHSKTGPKQPAEGLDLSNATASYQGLVGKASSSCGGKTRVVPSDVAASYLMNKLTGVGMCNGSKMPKGPGLPATEIDNIRNWICNGAQQN